MKRCRPVAILLATTLLAGTIWAPDSARASRMPQEMPGPIEVSDPDVPNHIPDGLAMLKVEWLVLVGTLGGVQVRRVHAQREAWFDMKQHQKTPR